MRLRTIGRIGSLILALQLAIPMSVWPLLVKADGVSPPTISIDAITTPTRTAPITISGTASDDIGVVDISLAITLHGGGTTVVAPDTIAPALPSTGPITWSYSWTPGVDGTYDIAATASDSDTPTVATRNDIVYDTTAPTLTELIPALPTITNNNNPGYAYSSDEAGTYALTGCGGGTGATTAGDNVIFLGPLVDGTYSGCTLDTTDAAGNIGTLAMSPFTVDTTKPTSTLTSPANSSYWATSVRVTGTATDAVGLNSVAVQYRLTGAGAWTDAIAYAAGGSTSFPVDYDVALPADGSYEFRIMPTDTAGNAGDPLAIPTATAVVYDTHTPAIAISSPAGSSVFNSSVTLLPVSGTAADTPAGINAPTLTLHFTPVGGGVEHTYNGVTYDGSLNWSTNVPLTGGSALPEGEYDLFATVDDNAGNTETSTTTYSITVDRTAPSLTAGVNVPIATPSTDNTPSFTFSSDEAGTIGFTGGCASATTTAVAGSNAVTLDSLADGSHTCAVTVTDAAGNASAPLSLGTFVVDTTAPTLTVTAPVATTYSNTTITVTGNAVDASSGLADISLHFGSTTIALNLATDINPVTGDWSKTVTTSDLPDGTYSLTVSATDNVGLTTTQPVAPVTVVFDHVNPNVAITSFGNDLVANAPVLVAGTSSDPAPASGVVRVEVLYRVSGPGAFAHLGDATINPDGSWQLSPDFAPADGVYDVQAIAYDQAGNTSSYVVTNLTYDTTNPAVAFTGSEPAASGQITRNNASFTGTASDGLTGIISVDLKWRANGTVGWSDLATLPVIAGDWSYTFRPASSGYYDFLVVGTDNAGNTDTDELDNLGYDYVNPTGTIDYPALNQWFNGAFSFYGTADDDFSGINQIRVRLGLQPWATLNLPTDYNPVTKAWSTTLNPAGLIDGTYRAQAELTDLAGNVATISLDSVGYDTVNPYGSWSNRPTNGYLSLSGGSQSFTATADDGLSGVASVAFDFRLQSDNSLVYSAPAAFVAGTSWSANVSSTDLPAGAYNVETVIADNAGNSTVADTQTLIVDNTAPVTTMSTPADDTVTNTPFSVTGSTSDDNSVVEVDLYYRSHSPSDPWIALTTLTNPTPGTPYTWSYTWDPVENGIYDLKASAVDAAGNVESSAYAYNLTYDTIDPDSATWDTPAAPTAQHGTFTLSGAASDALSGVGSVVVHVGVPDVSDYPYTASYDTGTGRWSVTLNNTPADPYFIAEGQYQVWLEVTDVAGNLLMTGNLGELLVDNSAPTVTVVDPGTPIQTLPTLSGTATDAGSPAAGITQVTIMYQRDGGGWSALTSPVAVTGGNWSYTITPTLADGTYDFQVYGDDLAGNTSNVATLSSIVIDDTDPVVGITNPVGGMATNLPIVINGTSSDNLSGVVRIAVAWSPSDHSFGPTALGDAVINPDGSWYIADWTPVNDGEYEITATAYDAAGNTSTATATPVMYDTTDPTVQIVNSNPLANNFTNSAITLDGSVSDNPNPTPITTVLVERRLVSEVTWTNLGTRSVTGGAWSVNNTPPADGRYEYRITATDAAGNTGEKVISWLGYDTTAPTGAITAPTTGRWFNGTFGASGTAHDNMAGVQQVMLRYGTLAAIDITAGYNSSMGTWLGTINPTGLANGLYSLVLTVLDWANNSLAEPVSVANIGYDTERPVITVNSPASDNLHFRTLVLAGSATDGYSGINTVGIEYRVSGGEWMTLDASVPVTSNSWSKAVSLPDGVYDFRVSGADVATNTAVTVLRTGIVLDNVKPATTLSSPGNDVYTNKPIVISGTSTDNRAVKRVTIKASDVNQNNWQPVAVLENSTPGTSWNWSYSWTPGEGTYDIKAYAEDAAGNVETTAYAHYVTYDKTAPTILETQLVKAGILVSTLNVGDVINVRVRTTDRYGIVSFASLVSNSVTGKVLASVTLSAIGNDWYEGTFTVPATYTDGTAVTDSNNGQWSVGITDRASNFSSANVAFIIKAASRTTGSTGSTGGTGGTGTGGLGTGGTSGTGGATGGSTGGTTETTGGSTGENNQGTGTTGTLNQNQEVAGTSTENTENQRNLVWLWWLIAILGIAGIAYWFWLRRFLNDGEQF